MPSRAQNDWTSTIYGTNASVYQPVLENGLKTAAGEVEGIVRILERSHVKPGSRILDLSCGIGRHSVELAERGYHVTGVDPSVTFLARAKELATTKGVTKGTRFIRGSFSNLVEVLSQGRQNNFSGAILMDNSIGVTGRDRDDLRLFKDLRTVVSKGGMLIVEINDRVNIARHYQWVLMQEFPDDLVRIWKCVNPPGSPIHEAEWGFYRKQSDQSLKHLLTCKVRVRHYSVAELRGLVRKAGWNYLSCYGSLYDLHRFARRDLKAILVFTN